jgi:predicted DNA binding CopG/RHH family protein
MKIEMIPYTMRIPENLHNNVKKMAMEQGQSYNSLVISLLQQALECCREQKSTEKLSHC